MLKKENRLTTTFQFNIVKKYGTKHHFDFFRATVLTPRNYNGPAKIGFVVPNTIHKKAAKRNRAKRLLREAVRLSLVNIPNNLWIAFMANDKILDKTYEQVCGQINRFIQKISVSH